MHRIHPRRRGNGAVVVIERPSRPTDAASWQDPTCIATAVPDASLPQTFSGGKLTPLRFESTALERDAWRELEQQRLPFQESPFEPAPGMSTAAGVVVEEADGRVWVVHPTNAFQGYRATFPKGTCEAGRTLQATAIVECFEESGLLVQLKGFLGDFDRSASRTRYYVATRIDGSPADMGWESQAVSLVPRQALPSLLTHPNDRPVLAALGLEVDDR